MRCCSDVLLIVFGIRWWGCSGGRAGGWDCLWSPAILVALLRFFVSRCLAARLGILYTRLAICKGRSTDIGTYLKFLVEVYLSQHNICLFCMVVLITLNEDPKTRTMSRNTFQKENEFFYASGASDNGRNDSVSIVCRWWGANGMTARNGHGQKWPASDGTRRGRLFGCPGFQTRLHVVQ